MNPNYCMGHIYTKTLASVYLNSNFTGSPPFDLATLDVGKHHN